MVRLMGRTRAASGPVRPGPGRTQSRHERPRSGRRLRSVAGQVFALQVVLVVLLALAGTVALVVQASHDSLAEARNRSLAVAESFANSPGLIPALRSPDPTAILEPRAEAARMQAGVDFIVVMNTQGIRYTHPDRDRIGKKFVGTIGPALAGHPLTEQITGTIGPLVQAVVPVTAPNGSVVGLVSAGIRTHAISAAFDRQLPILLGSAAAVLVLATGGTALVSRRLRRQTHGLDPGEMTRMYEHHDAVLHAVREGVVIVGGDGRLVGLVHERGRSIAVEWDDTRVSAVEASDGRRVAYGYDEAGRLVSSSGPSGVRRYVWGEQSGLVERVIDGDGVILLVNGYDEEGRVTWQRSPLGRTSRLNFTTPGIHAGQTDRAKAERQGRVTAEQRRCQVKGRHIVEHPLPQGNRLEIGDVSPQRHLGIGTAIDIFEQKSRQPPTRQFAIVQG